jgi:hypothetical protein
MQALLLSRTSLIWLLLVAATALSWEVGHGFGLHGPRQAGVAIIVVAFIKVRYVLLDFMEIRHAPIAMRGAAEVWAVGVCGVLIAMFLNTPAG